MIKRILTGLFIIFAFICTFLTTSFAAAPTGYPKPDAPHWQKSPIVVYIPQDPKSASMQNAFKRWQDASEQKLKFQYINDKKKADITVEFTDKVNGSDGPLGEYSLEIQGMEITKATIKIATKSTQIKKYSKNYIFTTMMHEVGHVIGMKDSDRKRSSIMHMPVDETQDILVSDKRNLYRIYGWDWINRKRGYAHL